MWSNGPLLLLRVRIRQKGGGFRLFLGLAGYAVSQCLLSWEPIFELIPGDLGRFLRGGSRTVLGVLRELQENPLEFTADLEPQGENTRVSIRLWNPLQKGETGRGRIR